MLLDDIMPVWDATRIEHRVIPGARADVYETALAVDLLDVPRRNAAVRAAFAVRAGGERLVQAVSGTRPDAPSEPPPAMRLGELPDRGEWLRLGARHGEEFVFGALGRFWAGHTAWEVVTADAFAGFDTPGVAKIVANLSFRDYGATQTLVSYEARTVATDPESRAQFLRYWRVVDPFVGVVMRGMLRLVADTVDASKS